MWSVDSFESKEDMIAKLRAVTAQSPNTKPAGTAANPPQEVPEGLSLPQFVTGIQALGWEGHHEQLLFSSLDSSNSGLLDETCLRWLEIEKKRAWRKAQAKFACSLEAKKREKAWQVAEESLINFKRFLKGRFGHYVRAWRRGLSPDGSMVLLKPDLFKACTNLGWEGDMRLLYKAFDRDDSGTICIEELDAKSAELIARFKAFIDTKFGSSKAAFQGLDRHNAKSINLTQLTNALNYYGFECNVKLLFHGLDCHGNKVIVQEDLEFLDKFKPGPFLLAAPNEQAAEEMKSLLLRSFKSYLKAWRHALDADSSNRCNFDEFTQSCKKIGFHGDVPGAWRALDRNWTGFITLREVDPVSSELLKDFKRWCDDEFGGVRSAFSVFDLSGDSDVSFREFRRSCRIYGFEGQITPLFHALDVEGNGALALDEILFLDEWEFVDDKLGGPSDYSIEVSQESVASVGSRVCHLTDYGSDSLGPGAYTVPCSFAANPAVPGVHFGGSFSFVKRPKQVIPTMPKDAPIIPAPNAYDDRRGREMTSPGRPQWQFPATRRECVEPCVWDDSKPGPASYSPLRHHGRSALCTPRRALKAHPLISSGASQVQPGTLFAPGRSCAAARCRQLGQPTIPDPLPGLSPKRLPYSL